VTRMTSGQIGLTSTAAAVSNPTQPPPSILMAGLADAPVNLMARKVSVSKSKNNPSVMGMAASTAPQGETAANIPPKNAGAGDRLVWQASTTLGLGRRG
jgi:hypothetical protein